MRHAIVLLVILAAAPAWAGPPAEAPASSADSDHDIADLPRDRLGVGVFFQDVTALTPGTGGFIAPVEGAVIGVAGTYQHRLSLDTGWFLDLGGGYGTGKQTTEVFQPFAFRDVTSFALTFARGGLGYEVRLTRRATAHAGGGLFYSRARATFENGASTTHGERFTTIGLDESIGVRLELEGNLGLGGEQYAAYGWGSGRGSDAKYSAAVKTSGYRAGLIVSF